MIYLGIIIGMMLTTFFINFYLDAEDRNEMLVYILIYITTFIVCSILAVRSLT